MKALTLIYGWFIIVCTYFCLWVISDYLLVDTILACLFLPFSFRLGLNLHSYRFLWIASYAAEFCVLCLLSQSFPEINLAILFILSLVSLPITFLFQKYYQGKQWQKLVLQACLIVGFSLLNSIASWNQNFSFLYAFLVNLTGALLVIPVCFLVSSFLFSNKWIPLTASLVHKPITLRTKHILIYTLLFAFNIYLQTHIPEEFQRVALFSLAIPIIILAYNYGWQGALLGTTLNSIALIASAKSFSYYETSDLLLSLSTQTITGIFLGLAIQHQRDLTQSISTELVRNRQLTRQLIDTEESIRRDIARELHDEIGQNITAIRTQASILKRIDPSEKVANSASMIEHLSLNIYDTTKGLLNRIRPRILDDLDLHQVILNLFTELGLETKQIQTSLNYHNPHHIVLDHVLEITLYRLCQEGLNNIMKYAQATKVKISLQIAPQQIKLTISDNGIGFDIAQQTSSLGLYGMRERVNILGGEFKVNSYQISHHPTKHGTVIQVTLPRF
ncbi:two-component system sensor histidine kinase UhpB [Pasteurellaceae bacterium 15-036681]|nr:two-component system sensor histidine kinase UhpB [Pasteurellaceae bacterium 15-036681]